MSLASGTRIGCYEIVDVLGAGGMGEVYRARDTKLGRDVALKVLPDLFAGDAERVARFQREAQVLASLNHPNIGAIHGLEDDAGADAGRPRVRALVLELIPGDTLADRIRRGPLPAAEAIAIGRQIAAALENAHERGVVHRDLKPANVKITPDGQVKVLDFGLAKALDTTPSSPQLSHSPTLTMGTMAGMVIGTAAYMSPEQAKGLPADQRSDVFSFGCVLFEMLSGRQAFPADSIAETLAAVLMRAPDATALPAGTPSRLRTLVQRCLEKDPKRRWQAVGDLAYELDSLTSDPGAPAVVAALPAARVPLWRRALSVVATAVVAAAAAAASTSWYLRPAQAPTVARFNVPLADATSQSIRAGSGLIALSPDGTSLVFAANRQLYLRSMGDLEARPIAGTNLDVLTPFLSPDGRWIGFFSLSDRTLKKIPIGGGTPLTICRVDTVGYGASWDGDQIVFIEFGKGIMRVSADGGVPESLVASSPTETLYGPQLIDSGRAVLFSSTSDMSVDRWDKAEIVVQPVGSTTRTVVVRGGSDARYLPTGHLVYGLGGTILAVPFDMAKRQTTGRSMPVLDGVMRAPNPGTSGAVAHFATSANGVLAYVPGAVMAAAAPKLLALVDLDGKIAPLGLPPQPYVHPRVSPDGSQVVVMTDDGKEAAIWVHDMKGDRAARRLTFGGRNMYPIWNRDGRYVTFMSDREGDFAMFREPADGTAVPERLTKPEKGVSHEPESWSPDGKTLSFNLVRGGSQGVWMWSSTDGRLAMAVDVPNTVEKHSVFSPNGKWFAYMSTSLVSGGGIAVGATSVFVEPFPRTGAKYQVASGSARTPLWSPDGRQLFYHEQNTNQLKVVDVRTEPAFSTGTPRTLPIEATIHPIAQRNYDVMPDGKRLLVVLPAQTSSEPARRQTQQAVIVLNWFDELKTRVPVK